jgi:Ca2+-binding RTX toxin-like protein
MRREHFGKRLLVALVTCLAVCALGPASALAGTIVASGTAPNISIDYTGEAGEDDVLTVTGSGGTYTFTENGNIAAPDPPCTGGGTQTVICTGVGRIRVDGDGGNDFLTVDPTGLDTVFTAGGAGNDTILGSNDPNVLEGISGDEGDDTLDGRDGDDDVQGGLDDDRAAGGPGADFVDGEDGTDVVTGDGDGDTVGGSEGDGDNVDGGDGEDVIFGFGGDGSNDVQNGGAGFDLLFYFDNTGPPTPDAFNINLANGTAGRLNPEPDSISGFEDGLTGAGNDTLVGSNGANRLASGGGNDSVEGGGGADTLSAGDGEDSVNARDGVNDRVDCGSGNDTAILDQFDENVNCENAQVATVPPFGTQPSDTTSPNCSTSRLDTSQTRRQFFRGFSFRVVCDEATRLANSVLAFVRRVRGRLFTSRVGEFVLAERSLRLGTGTRTVRVRPSRRFRRQLGRRFRARVRIVASDAAGNRRTLIRTIRVR